MINKSLDSINKNIIKYISESQNFSAGEYHGAFWSEKAYHGPLLDWHGGGSHHHRGAGSAALALWQYGQKKNDSVMLRNAELGFDWLTARQHERGGWLEIQNNEKPSDWESTGLDEVSTISSAFAIHGLGLALLNGLTPQKSYMDCLKKAGHWFLSIERPVGSGIFPHHERSPHDTLNANAHSVESLALIYRCLDVIYDKKINIFLEGAMRGFIHTLPLQLGNGCYPYRYRNGSTINYTSLVLWCFLNTLDILPEKKIEAYLTGERINDHFSQAVSFLTSCIGENGELSWDINETSTAKYNIWTYVITYNVLMRIGGEATCHAEKLLRYIVSKKTSCGLLPMRDENKEENITRCLFMQADMFLFLFNTKNNRFWRKL